MSLPYKQDHWHVFSSIPFQPAGAVGENPASWAQKHKLKNLPANIPNKILNRGEVREICRDPDAPVLLGYICAMAWGGQGLGPGGSKHVVMAWQERKKLEVQLKRLKDESLSRLDAYKLFLDDGKIQGLGPAYWTKLLYFFSPSDDFYIMDQWTAKSINLITDCHVVKMLGNAVAGDNKGGNYQAYCEVIDAMAEKLNLPGADVEEMLMSKGGRNPWPWRAYVNKYYRYDKAILVSAFPHISAAEF